MPQPVASPAPLDLPVCSFSCCAGSPLMSMPHLRFICRGGIPSAFLTCGRTWRRITAPTSSPLLHAHCSRAVRRRRSCSQGTGKAWPARSMALISWLGPSTTPCCQALDGLATLPFDFDPRPFWALLPHACNYPTRQTPQNSSPSGQRVLLLSPCQRFCNSLVRLFRMIALAGPPVPFHACQSTPRASYASVISIVH